MIWQCQAYQRAIRRAYAQIETIRHISDMGESAYAHQQQIFSDLHSAVAFAGNVAKMLAPREKEPVAKARAQARADRIKHLLNLRPPSDPVVHHALLVRDALEHIDARLDVWALRSINSNLLIHGIMPQRSLAHVDVRDLFTRFDTDTGDFSVQKESVNLDALGKRISKILTACLRAYGRNAARLERLIARAQPI
jgi:hypothetical protein